MRVAAFIAALIMCGASGTHADESDTFTVGIRLRVDRSIASSVIADDLKDETGSLWRPYGVQLEWTDARAAGAQAHGFSVDAIVEWSVLSDWVPVLGNAQVALDGPARPIRVSIDATERVLASGTGSRASRVRMHDCELARALGRVLAHELGHVLLAVPNHASAGLMRRSFSPNELAAPDRAPFQLTRNDVGRLKSRVQVITGQISDF